MPERSTGPFAAAGLYLRRVTGTSLRLFRGRDLLWLRWAALVQLIIDVAAFHVFLLDGKSANASHLASFAIAFLASSAIAWQSIRQKDPRPHHLETASALVFDGLAAVLFRAGVLALALRMWNWPPSAAILPAAIVAAVIVHLGQAYLTVAESQSLSNQRNRRRLLIAGIIAYLVLLRLVYLGLPELIPEEAYYWNYAQHLDWGYLDHPPLVAWVIALGTAVWGSSEFGVRIGAFCFWLVTAAFAFALARDLYDRTTAVRTVLLVSALPFFFGIGLVATPDATLTAAWAGALYFLGRALLKGKAGAWIGAGICLGLGLLSKYTIALLIPGAGLLMLLDAEARRWWRRPQPYLALALTVVLFLPVIYWNSQHAWASFLFQTAGRLRETAHFSVHELVGAALFLLTPTGLVAAILALGSRDSVPSSDPGHTVRARQRRFVLLFTIVPLTVFVIFSLRHHTKLNWTGPTWLAVLPAVAWMMTQSATPLNGRVIAFVRRLWMPTIMTVVVLYGALLHYLVLGLPGIPYPALIADIAGWKDLQRQIAAVENQIAERTNQRPLVVGMDRYNIASELAFYGYPDGSRRTAGRHLFGEASLMYRYWFPEPEQDGKTMALVARQEGQLISSEVVSRFDSLGTVTKVPVRWNGRVVRTYYCRVGLGYRSRVTNGAPP